MYGILIEQEFNKLNFNNRCTLKKKKQYIISLHSEVEDVSFFNGNRTNTDMPSITRYH